MKTASEYHREAIDLRHALEKSRRALRTSEQRLSAERARLANVAMLSAGMRLGDERSQEMADAIDETLGLVRRAKP